MLLRPGNAGSNDAAGHIAVLAAAIRQIPSRMRSRLLVRVDGAGASHELIAHLLSLTSRRRTVLFTCGWAITEADEQAIRLLPADAWQAAVDQDGTVQKGTAVAEVTHLMSRAAGWPQGLRWIVRRTKPSRRQARNLTALEKATGWRYSVIVTNIPDAGIPDVPGSHHPQLIDVLHREHAIVGDRVRTAKAMGLRNLPSIISSRPPAIFDVQDATAIRRVARGGRGYLAPSITQMTGGFGARAACGDAVGRGVMDGSGR